MKKNTTKDIPRTTTLSDHELETVTGGIFAGAKRVWEDAKILWNAGPGSLGA